VKRVAALVAAVAMVAGALWLRGRDGGDGGGGDDPPAGESAPPLVCATELADVCQGLDVEATVEDAGATADRLAAGEPLGADGWLVAAPWPDMAVIAGEPGRVPALDAGDVLARSPAVLVVWSDRADALREACAPDGPGWACLGAAAGRPWTDVGGQPDWGPVRVAHPDPGTVAGLTVAAAAAADFLDATDYATNDLDSEEFDAWFTQLEGDVGENVAPGGLVARMLTFGRAAFGAVGVLEAEAGPVLAGAQRDDVEVLYPSPMVTADVVLATVPGAAGADELRDLVGGDDAAAILRDAGWRVGGEAPDVPFDPPGLADGSGLPAPGVLVALRQRAVEAQR
jgi:Bacterial extracellular solute-binding protein